MAKLTRVYGIGKHADKSISFEADPERLLSDYDLYEAYVKGCEHTPFEKMIDIKRILLKSDKLDSIIVCCWVISMPREIM